MYVSPSKFSVQDARSVKIMDKRQNRVFSYYYSFLIVTFTDLQGKLSSIFRS